MIDQTLPDATHCRIIDRFIPLTVGDKYSGYVVLEPARDYHSVLDAVPAGTGAVNEFKAVVDADGYIDIEVPAGDAPGLSSPFTYRVRRVINLNNVPVDLPAFDIVAPGGTIVYLTEVAPVAHSAGVQIVRGETGPPGPAGPPGQIGPAGQQWKNIWESTVDYVNADSVSYDGSTWFAAGDPPVGEVPSAESAYWNMLSQQGAPGGVGPKGDKGDTVIGPPGPANSLSLVFTELAPGAMSSSAITGQAPNQTLHLNLAPAAPVAGGGGGSVQDTGLWRYSHYGTAGTWAYTMVQRVGDMVTITMRTRMQSSWTDFNAITRGSLPGTNGGGFTGPGQWLTNVYSGGQGKVFGEANLLATSGFIQIDLTNERYNESDVNQYNIYGDMYTSWTYRTFDEFPVDPSASLPGFMLMTSNSQW